MADKKLERFWLMGPGSEDDGPMSTHPTLKAAQAAGDDARSEGAGGMDIVDTQTGESWGLAHDNRSDDQEWEKSTKLGKDELAEMLASPAKQAAEKSRRGKLPIPEYLLVEGGHGTNYIKAGMPSFILTGALPLPVRKDWGFDFGVGGDGGSRSSLDVRIDFQDHLKRCILKKTELQSEVERDEAKIMALISSAEKVDAATFLAKFKYSAYMKQVHPKFVQTTELRLENLTLKEAQALCKNGFKAVTFPKKLVVEVKEAIDHSMDISSILGRKCKVKV